MPIDLKRDDLPLEMVDDLYENQPDWLHAFIHFLSTDESISDGITRMEGGSGWLSRILNTSLDKVKTPEETRKFLIENPFFTFLLSGKTPGEFQKLCDSGELSAEVDKILGSPEDEAGDSIFAQFNQGKIFEWADTLGARVYAVLFNEKGEVRTEILGALDGQGLKELRDAGIINIDNDSTKSQIFTSLCMPLVGLLATYVNQTVKAGIEKNKKLLSEEKDEIMKRYVKSVGDTVLLDSINPNDLALTEAITEHHASVPKSEKFYLETKLRVLSQEIADSISKDFSLEGNEETYYDEFSKKFNESVDSLNLIDTMANLAFFKENGAFPKAQELESFEKFKADCTPAFRAELKFEVFSELKSMLVTRGELEARIFEENTKMKTQRLEEVISRSEEKLEKATKDWADSEKEMSELKKRQKKPDLTDEEKSQVGREINQVMFKQERIPKVKIITELIRNTKDEIEKLKVSSFQFYISSMDLFKLDDSNVDVSTQWENYYQEFLKNLDGSTGGFNLIDTMTKEAFFKEHGHFPEDSDPAFEAFKKTNSSYLHAQAEFSEFVRVKERQGARERTTEQLRDLVKLESELFDKKQNLQIPLIQASIEIAKNNLETAARNRRVLEDTSREADKRRKKNELKEILKTELKGAIDSARREIGNSTGIAMERKNQLESVILDARRKLEEKNFPEYIRKEKSRISDELRLAQNKLNLIEKSTTVEQRFSNSEFMEQLSIVNDLTRRLWLDPKNLTQFEDDERKKLRETIRSSSEELGNISTFVQARIGELSETIKQTTNTIFEPELLDAAYEKEKNRLWAIYSNANSELEHSTNPRKTAELILKQEKEIKELQTMGNQLRIAAEIVGNDNFKLDSTIPSTEVDFTNLLECLFESPTFRTEFDPLLNDLMQRTNTQVSSPGILRQLDFKKEQKVEVFLQKVAEFLSVSEVSNDGQAQRHLSVWLEKVLSSDPELISKINNSPEIQNNLFRMFCQRCIEVKKDEAKSQNIRGLPMGILEKRLQTESAQMKKLADYPQLSPSNNAQKQKKWQEGKEKLETGLSRVKLDVRESHAQDILYTRQQDQIKQRKEAFENMRATLSVTINKLSEIDRALENAIGGKENLKMDSPMSQKYLVVNSRLRELQVVQADLVKAQEQFKIDSGNYGSRKLSMDEFYTASKEASIQLRTCVSETHRLHHAIRPELTEIPKFFPTVKGLKDLIRSALNSFRDFFDKNPSYTQKTDKAVEKAFTELETAGKKIDTRLKKEGIVTEPENASPNLKKS